MYDFISIFFFNDTATTEIYTLSLHDALPISPRREAKRSSRSCRRARRSPCRAARQGDLRSEEHTSELQSHLNLACRLLLEKKKAITESYLRKQATPRPTEKCLKATG